MKHTTPTAVKTVAAALLSTGIFASSAYAAEVSDYVKVNDNNENRTTTARDRYDIAIGIGASAANQSSLAVGAETKADGNAATALGSLANATGTSATALGQQTEAAANAATAVGRQAKASGNSSTAVGSVSSASAENAIAFGSGTSASGVNSAALGQGAQAGGVNTVALGQKAQASGRMSTAVGSGALAEGLYATATGAAAKASGNASVALGLQSQALGGTSVAIGRGAVANDEYSVALGSGSTTAAAVGTNSATVGGVTYGGFAGTAPTATVSVGAAGSERTLTNVAAGRIDATSTDAINGSQLNAVAGQVSTNTANINNMQQQIYNYSNGIDRMNQRIDDMEDDLRAGIAGATAIAFLQRPNEAGKSMVSAAVGGFRDQQALAVGYARNSDNNKWSVKAGIGVNTQKDVNWGGSVGYQW